MNKKLKYAAAAIAVFAAAIYVNDTNHLATHQEGKPVLLAHRGIAQRFDDRELKNDTCTAPRMLPSTHQYLENTISSMRAGFTIGADIVELDVHPTTDGEFAVFHDWTLDCRTDGHGVTREHSMAYLKKLDIGHGYTADGGKTFPFRGKGIGLMPTLTEVLATFPEQRLLINVKSRDPSEGEKLAAVLNKLPAERRAQIMVYGGDEPVEIVRQQTLDVRTISRSTIKSCLLRYIGYGWSGVVPKACSNAMVMLPTNVTPWLWGWPDRFLNRMKAANSEVFVLGPYRGSEFSTGIDTPEQFARLPQTIPEASGPTRSRPSPRSRTSSHPQKVTAQRNIHLVLPLVGVSGRRPTMTWKGKWQNQYGSVVNITDDADRRISGTFKTALTDSGFYGQEIPVVGIHQGDCISFVAGAETAVGDAAVSYTGLLRDGKMETMWFVVADSVIKASAESAPGKREKLSWWRSISTNADTFERVP